MAPETVSGIVGRRCDIWSVGCVLIEMLTANHPWAAHPKASSWSIAEALQYILASNEIPPLPAVTGDNTGAEEKLESFLMQCLKREHKERPYADELLRHPFLSSS
ncbi:unnamed protein product [Amoebophrya sp. A25]|nr:unnamed protein product [Amoebophrya sp. A25]|eukprot:GSA25T00016991001.1